MKKLSLYLITYSLLLGSFAQSYNPDKVNKKAIALYNQAMVQAQDDHLAQAAELLPRAPARL